MRPRYLGSSVLALILIIGATIVVIQFFTPSSTIQEPIITGKEADLLDQLQRLQHRIDLLEMRCTTSSSSGMPDRSVPGRSSERSS